MAFIKPRNNIKTINNTSVKKLSSGIDGDEGLDDYIYKSSNAYLVL